MTGRLDPAPYAEPGRFVLWIDGVGGYLVCPQPVVVVGQYRPGANVDIAVHGDLRSKHARILRDNEGYVLEADGTVRVAGRLIGRAANLLDGVEIEFGTGVKFDFRQPHPFSASATLESKSHARLEPRVDGAVLMADALVLGPQAASHVVCPDWEDEVVLFRSQGGLWIRGAGELSVDGVEVDGRSPIAVGSRIEGPDFSMSLEGLSFVV